MNLRRQHRPFIAALTIILTMALTGGCGGNDDSKPAKGDTTVAKPDNSEPELADADIEKYFEALSSNDVDRYEAVETLTSPDSIAFGYLRTQTDAANAAIDGGNPYEPDDLKKIDKSYESCSEDEEGKETCATYSDFESKDGKLASFKINGTDLTDRITVGDGSEKKVGDLAVVEFLSSYKSPVSGNLFVNMRVTSKKESINVGLFEATYRGPDKRRATATSADGGTELSADSTATMGMSFKAADTGGAVTLLVFDKDYGNEVEVSFKTR